MLLYNSVLNIFVPCIYCIIVLLFCALHFVYFVYCFVPYILVYFSQVERQGTK
nr:MAG TPA: hypothetical protein [Caudoviricetes sp.]